MFRIKRIDYSFANCQYVITDEFDKSYTFDERNLAYMGIKLHKKGLGNNSMIANSLEIFIDGLENENLSLKEIVREQEQQLIDMKKSLNHKNAEMITASWNHVIEDNPFE